jgi:hypothetical protein
VHQSDAFVQPSLRARKGHANSDSFVKKWRGPAKLCHLLSQIIMISMGLTVMLEQMFHQMRANLTAMQFMSGASGAASAD